MTRSIALLVLFFAVMPAKAVDADKVSDAIAKGSNYLLSTPLLGQENATYGIGAAALAGLALLETDVRPDHPTLLAIHRAIREQAVRENSTYQTALAIIFLDRYASPLDIPLIQILGARLLAGQTLTAGWGYQTFDGVTPADEARIRSSLSAPLGKDKINSEAARIITLVATGRRAASALGSDDNSNTQFAIVGLWVARRSGVPSDNAFLKLQSRFMRTQSPGDNGWDYSVGTSGSTPSMTCAGLLGLAAAKASSETELVTGRTGSDGKPVEADEEDPFLKPPPPGAKKGGDDEAAPPPPTKVDAVTAAARDKAIDRALTGLGRLLHQPGAVGSGGSNLGGTSDLYFFWSLERVAVAFGLDTVGGVDWYKWGCDAILPAQRADGSWPGSYTPVVSTSFAILFLKKANFTGDLSRKLSGKVKDPGDSELRGGRGNVPSAISAIGTVQNAKPDPNNPNVPVINAVRKTTEADKIADSLVTATDRDWPSRLRVVKETKGPQQTVALAQAIASLEGKRLYQAREALAERLTRMTGDTLKRMLTDRDAEIRRAACLAVAMKDERFVIPDVIDRITDPNDMVARAAKAALKAISGEDHGPLSGASDEEKRNAAQDWRYWYATDSRKRHE